MSGWGEPHGVRRISGLCRPRHLNTHFITATRQVVSETNGPAFVRRDGLDQRHDLVIGSDRRCEDDRYARACARIIEETRYVGGDFRRELQDIEELVAARRACDQSREATPAVARGGQPFAEVRLFRRFIRHGVRSLPKLLEGDGAIFARDGNGRDDPSLCVGDLDPTFPHRPGHDLPRVLAKLFLSYGSGTLLIAGRHAKKFRPPRSRRPSREDRQSAPGRIRTSDTQDRSLVLYPAELRARARVLPCCPAQTSPRRPSRAQIPQSRLGLAPAGPTVLNTGPCDALSSWLRSCPSLLWSARPAAIPPMR